MADAPTDPDAVYALIRRIPPGFVTAYGDLTPGAPRAAGRALSQMPPGLPWWRVVRADGSLAKGSDQRQRLMEEGVPFRGARVLMAEVHLPREALAQIDAPAAAAESSPRRQIDAPGAGSSSQRRV